DAARRSMAFDVTAPRLPALGACVPALGPGDDVRAGRTGVVCARPCSVRRLDVESAIGRWDPATFDPAVRAHDRRDPEKGRAGLSTLSERSGRCAGGRAVLVRRLAQRGHYR